MIKDLFEIFTELVKFIVKGLVLLVDYPKIGIPVFGLFAALVIAQLVPNFLLLIIALALMWLAAKLYRLGY